MLRKVIKNLKSALPFGPLMAVVLLAAACGSLTPTASPAPPVAITEEITSITSTVSGDTHSLFPVSSFKPDQPIKFEHISLEQGLSQSSVYCILQDNKGFMWFGTEDGLNKYDGYTFTHYRHIPGDPTSLSHNHIRAMIEDDQGTLWIGTDGGGLNAFDRDTEQFVRYQGGRGPHNVSSDFIRAIFLDQEGILWIGTEGNGLSRFDRSKNRFTHYYHNPDDPYSLSDNVVHAIYQARDGTLWIGTDGRGINRFDRSTNRFIHYQHDPHDPHSLSSSAVRTIFQDRDGALWIGTDDRGLDKFDPSTGHFIHYQNDPQDPDSLGHNAVRAIFQDREGLLWIATFGGGLDVLDLDGACGTNTEQFIHHRNDLSNVRSLSSDAIWSIYEDREGILWVGTHGGGINKFDKFTEPFIHCRARPNDPNSLNNNLIYAIQQDQDRVLWIGTGGGGLNKLDRSTGEVTHYQNDPYDPFSLRSNLVRAIHKDGEGVLWLGTGAGGIDKFDRSTGRFTHYDPHNSSTDQVLTIYQDRDGVLWIGTAGSGIYWFDRATESFIHPGTRATESFIPNPGCVGGGYIKAIHKDRSGLLWIGSGGGLSKIDRERRMCALYQKNPQDPHSLSHNIVTSVYEDQEGTLWVGTFGGGLNKFDRETETFIHYSEKDGLPNDMVYGILEDKGGCLWLSTNRGLSRFDPHTETFKNYDVSDGLQSNEFNGGAYFKSDSGEMFFGGINGFNAFYPSDLRGKNTYVPPVVLTYLAQGGEEVNVAQAPESVGEITFHWPNNFFEFEFAALSYARPEKNQYAYKLEGLEKDWVYVGTRRFGRYTSLPGGMYTLRIKGSNNDEVWNETGASIKITVVPPFWGTWWFKGIVALALVAGAIGGYRLRIRNVEARSRELERQVERRTAELRQEVEQRLQVEEALRQSEMEKAVAAERSRLARELHDAVTQTLFSASLIAEVLPAQWESDPEEALQLLKELRQLSRGALAEMRTLLLELRPAVLVEANLGDLLRQLGEAITGRKGVPVTVTVEGCRDLINRVSLPDEVHVTLYRIAQEALNNVSKHAQADRVAVSLQCQPEAGVELCIRDDGRGFDPDHVPPDSLGLGIMRERAEAIAARLEIESQPGHGTQVKVRWKG